MNLISWGNYPKTINRAFNFDNHTALKHILTDYDQLIPYGNGRSYGDSALSKNIIAVKPHHYFLNFNDSTGLLHVQTGLLLSEILNVFIPRGWFLRIVPGTKMITVGGAIASDVHGKNHHLEGCFSECVHSFNLMLPNGEIVICSKQKNSELFKASCGGMGLTGVILEAKIWLKKINSKYINQTTIKTKNLKQTFEAFEHYQTKPYSVAWIDCLAKGDELGKCLLMVGEPSDESALNYQTKKKLNIPCMLPSWALHPLAIKAFNFLYYNKINDRVSEQIVDIDTFFFPLDGINNWNRIYGKKGFIQYQIILPKATSLQGLQEILEIISKSGKSSFLAVLKLYGKANANYLSFPMEGYGLALDFRLEKGLFELLDRLDSIVIKQGGRIYLAKDARVSQAVFEQGYPKIEIFRALRKKYKMTETFSSFQSRRIGI